MPAATMHHSGTGGATAAVGIDVGKSKIAAAWVAPSGLASDVLTMPSPAIHGVKAVIRDVVEIAERARALKKETPVAIGVGAPGVIDIRSGTILYGASIPGWAGTKLRAALQQRLRLPTYVCNDAAAAGVAEHRWGAARGAARAAYITISTGLGYALTEGRDLPWPIRTVSPEAAHTRMFPGGRSGRCALSGRSLTLAVEEEVGVALDPKEIFERARTSDARLAPFVNQFADAAAWLCAAVDTLAKPDVIVLGGAIALGQPQLFDLIGSGRAALTGADLPQVSTAPIRLAALGAHAGVAGAGSIALQALAQGRA